ncbi:hypothetical protein FRB98_002762 [Tulasnella sp. 332]|nr:hypothetical protein FRB98_002762 [Tulasnella sp. 332]
MADRCMGVQHWSLNITTKLANDPTRPAFKEFVQVHGFLFLEEFLEDALKGPKDQTVVDLAKTPGRRKDVPKTTRAAAVAMAASQKKIKALNFSMETDKENHPTAQASTSQNALQISPVKRQKGKEKEARVDGDGHGGDESWARPLQQKVAFASVQEKSGVNQVAVTPVAAVPRSTSPDPKAVQPSQGASIVQHVAEDTAEALETVAEAPVSLTNKSESQGLSVIVEDDDVDLTMIPSDSQPQESTPTRSETPVSETVSAPVATSTSIKPRDDDVGSSLTSIPPALVQEPSTEAPILSVTIEASQECSRSPAQRPDAIAPGAPHSLDQLLQASSAPIASRPVSGPSTSPSIPALAISDGARTHVAAAAVPMQPAVQVKVAADHSVPINQPGSSAVPLTRASTVPNLNLFNHDAAALPQQQPHVRSSWLREALLPAAPKQSMGAALIAQAKKSMGVRPSGMGIGMARASGVKRKSDSVDFEDRREERKSKAFKTSYYGGAKTSEVPNPVIGGHSATKVIGNLVTEKPRPVEQQPEDETYNGMTDFEVEVGGDEDEDEDKTTLSKLAEAIREENNKRLAKSTALQHGETVNEGPHESSSKKAPHYPVDIDLTGRFNFNVPSLESTSPAPGVVKLTEPQDIKVAGPSELHVLTIPAPSDQQKRSLSHERLSISELVSSSQSNTWTKTKQVDKPVAVATGGKPFALLIESVASTTTPENSPPRAVSAIARSTSDQVQATTTTTTTVVREQVVKGVRSAEERPLFPERGKAAAAAAGSANKDVTYSELSQWEEMMFGLSSKKVQPLPVSTNAEQSRIPAQHPANAPLPARIAQRAAPGSSTAASAPRTVHSPSHTLSSNSYPFDVLPQARAAATQPYDQLPLSRQATFASQTSTQSSFADSIFATSQPIARTFAHNSEMDPFSQASTQPTEYVPSQDIKENTAPQLKGKGQEIIPPAEVPSVARPPTGPYGPNIFSNDGEDDEVDAAMDADGSSSETDDDEPAQGDITASASMTGLLGSAANFVVKAFGGSAKKPTKADQLKVLNAAATAKKDQEEKERKKTRTKELMEQRRLAAAQKKVEDEKTKQADLERKKKEESEKRKRERDEMNISKIGNKGKGPEDEPAKKRKITVEMDKRPLKKAPSKDKLNASFQASAAPAPGPTATRAAPPRPQSQQAQYASSLQPLAKTLVKKPSGILASSSQPITSSSAPSGPSFSKLPPSFQRPSASVKLVGAAGPSGSAPAPNGAKPAPKSPDRPPTKANGQQDKQQPSQALRADMQARVQAQLAAKNRDAALASEQIELPDINSEYENSDDEERNKATLPDWAHSPVLRQQLIDQSTIDPEEYFGAIPELKMEEIFKKTRVSKFRARTSSANWNGADKLTLLEREEYARSMGYLK